MPFGLPMFTLIHVVLSVLGIIAGLVVVGGLIAGAQPDGVAPDPTCGFGSVHEGCAALSWVPLARGAGVCLARGWRTTYIVTAVAALCLNVFVLVVQPFAKTPALAQLAPTRQEAPFAATQALVLVIFAWLGWAALRGFRTAKAGG